MPDYACITMEPCDEHDYYQKQVTIIASITGYSYYGSPNKGSASTSWSLDKDPFNIDVNGSIKVTHAFITTEGDKTFQLVLSFKDDVGIEFVDSVAFKDIFFISSMPNPKELA